MISLYSLRLVREKEIRYPLESGIYTPQEIAEIAMNFLHIHEQTEEVCYLFTLDTKNKINGLFEVSRGSLNSSIVHPREIYKRALIQNANAIAIVHNHPSGNPKPSNEDISITCRLIDAGNIIGIKLLDHIIIGNDSYISLKKENII